ncbi:MAG: hypothetical protein HQL23_09645, partial [Candidatus Omnitrophica bacterium]|nr:hypothetical protein [Candidatus Omnitrophota bacterium]
MFVPSLAGVAFISAYEWFSRTIESGILFPLVQYKDFIRDDAVLAAAFIRILERNEKSAIAVKAWLAGRRMVNAAPLVRELTPFIKSRILIGVIQIIAWSLIMSHIPASLAIIASVVSTAALSFAFTQIQMFRPQMARQMAAVFNQPLADVSWPKNVAGLAVLTPLVLLKHIYVLLPVVSFGPCGVVGMLFSLSDEGAAYIAALRHAFMKKLFGMAVFL